jgi:hypothetical protein
VSDINNLASLLTPWIADKLNPGISCHVYNSGAITLTNTVITALTFDSERWDTDSMHSAAVNTGRITFNTAGWCIVRGHVGYAFNPTGDRSTGIRLNNATTIQGFTVPASGVNPTLHSVMTLYQFAVGDYIELTTYQSSAGNLNVIVGANYTPEFWAHRLG